MKKIKNKTSNTKLSLDKFSVAKLDNINTIKGGDLNFETTAHLQKDDSIGDGSSDRF